MDLEGVAAGGQRAVRAGVGDARGERDVGLGHPTAAAVEAGVEGEVHRARGGGPGAAHRGAVVHRGAGGGGDAHRGFVGVTDLGAHQRGEQRLRPERHELGNPIRGRTSGRSLVSSGARGRLRDVSRFRGRPCGGGVHRRRHLVALGHSRRRCDGRTPGDSEEGDDHRVVDRRGDSGSSHRRSVTRRAARGIDRHRVVDSGVGDDATGCLLRGGERPRIVRRLGQTCHLVIDRLRDRGGKGRFLAYERPPYRGSDRQRVVPDGHARDQEVILDNSCGLGDGEGRCPGVAVGSRCLEGDRGIDHVGHRKI